MSDLTSSRRRFLKRAAAAPFAASTVAGLPAASYRRILGANERVTLGVIGIGGITRHHLQNLAEIDDADVAALCDVYRPHLDRGLGLAPDARPYTDLRHVIDRSDIDALLVGTPDHWHAWATVTGCAAGKDVYVEKPASLTIAQGRAMVEAAHRHGRIVQVGTQQRSAPLYARVREIVQSGQLGDVRWVRTWNFSNSSSGGMGRPADAPPPPELEWDLWLGPAPDVPYNPNRFRSFRRFWDYAGGRMTDWGTHHLDIVQWAMNVDAPLGASASGGNFVFDDNRETPDTLLATLEYPGFLCTYESRYHNGHAPEESDHGIQFYGSRGTLFVNRRGLKVLPEPDSGLEPFEEPGDGNSHALHMRNFLDCVKSRERPICDIETGHRSSTAATLGNIAYRTGRRIRWDRAAETIPDDAEAAALLNPPTRSPWTL